MAQKKNKTTTKTVRKVSRKKSGTAATSTAAVAVAAAAAPAPVVQNNATATTTATTTTATAVEATWETSFERVLELQSVLTKTMKELNTEVKTLKKRFAKELRTKKRAKKSTTKRAPSGFAKPTRISAELCNFLGKPAGTEMARTEVTKLLTQYVREKNLQDPNNKRTIVPDDRLKKLLNVSATDTVTYFNLQRHMKPHFPKSATATATATATANVSA